MAPTWFLNSSGNHRHFIRDRPVGNPTRTHNPRKLDKSAVDTAMPEAQPYVLWDTEVAGFGLRVLPSGRKIFQMKYRTKSGRSRKPNIGVYGWELTAAEARKIARDWRVVIASGGDPKTDRDAPNSFLTFRQIAEKFIEEYAKPKKRTWRADQRILVGSWGKGGKKFVPSRYFRPRRSCVNCC